MKTIVGSALVVEDGDLIFNYVNYYVDDGFLVIIGDKKLLLTDGRYIEHAKLKANAISLLQSEVSLEQALNGNGVKKVGLVYKNTSAKLFSRLINGGFEVYDAEIEYQKFSSIKTASQLEKIKKACEITETAFFKTLPFIKTGVSELEVSAVLEYNFKMLGGQVGFETIVAFSSGGSVPHYKTSDKKLEPDSAILMDFGCSYQGYLSDMTRTFYYGEPTDKFLSVYSSVKTAWHKAYSEIRSGMTCMEADGVARSYLRSCGLDKFFTHSLGHGLGVKIHEFPTLSPKSSTVLCDGMVFSIEPGVYLENEFGVRIEDTVVLQNGRCVSLMTSDKEPIILSVK